MVVVPLKNNDLVEYYGKMSIGTPPQEFLVMLCAAAALQMAAVCPWPSAGRSAVAAGNLRHWLRNIVGASV